MNICSCRQQGAKTQEIGMGFTALSERESELQKGYQELFGNSNRLKEMGDIK